MPRHRQKRFELSVCMLTCTSRMLKTGVLISHWPSINIHMLDAVDGTSTLIEIIELDVVVVRPYILHFAQKSDFAIADSICKVAD